MKQTASLFEIAADIPTSGNDFFYSLVEHLARSLGANCAWIAESLPAPKFILRTLAVSIGGRDAENFEYSIVGSPAEDMLEDAGICLVPTSARVRFPHDSFLRRCDANGYAGIPLVDSKGEAIGLLAVASRSPFNNARLVASQLRVCASRAAAELERRRADAALKASEARMKVIFNHAPDAYLLLSLNGKLLEANRAAEKLTGLTAAEMVGRNVLLPGIMPETDIRRAAARLQERAAGAPPSLEEFTILHRNGGKAFVETWSKLATIDGEKVMLLCMRDITGRKIAQQESQNRLDRIQRLQHAALQLATHEAMTGGSAKQIAAHVTRTVCGLTGAVGAGVWLFPAERELRCLDRFEASSGIHFGGEAVISGNCLDYRSELQESRIVIVTDVAADAFSTGPERVRLIPEGTGQLLEMGIRQGDRIGGVLRIEHPPGEAHYWEPAEMQFVHVASSLLGLWLWNADRSRVDEAQRKVGSRLEQLQRAVAAGIWERNIATAHVEWSDESMRILRDRLHPDDLSKVDAAIAGVLLTGEPSEVSFRIPLPDGSRRFLRERVEIETDLSGEPVRLRGTLQDITEIGNLEEQLQTVQRLDRIGRMTTEIAHEFGDLLTVIQGHGARIRRQPAEQNAVRGASDAILGACQNASMFIRQLLGVTQPELSAARCDINSIVRDFERMLRSMLGPGLELSFRFDPEAGTVEARESDIQQILLSLAAIAQESMPLGGHFLLETAYIHREKEVGAGDNVPGLHSWVRLTAASTGHGATGSIAMSGVQALVDCCGGRMEIAGQSGIGTTIRIFFPCAEAEECRGEEFPSADDAIRGTETILVVEDQQEIRTLACTVLESLGYKVLSAANADAALRLEQEYRGGIDLMLTDVVMPGMHGDELSDRLCRLRPSIKVLFMSGYNTSGYCTHAGIQKDNAGRGRGFIRKPFDPFALAAKIRQLLGSLGAPCTILVAGVDEGVQGMLRSVLSTAGYRVMEASSSAEMAAKIRKGGIDILVAGGAITTTVESNTLRTIWIADKTGDAPDASHSRTVVTQPIQPDALLATVRNLLPTAPPRTSWAPSH